MSFRVRAEPMTRTPYPTGAIRSRAREPVFVPMRASGLPAVMEIERRAFVKPWGAGLFMPEHELDFSRLELARSADLSEAVLLGYAYWWVVVDEGHILNLAVDRLL